MSDPIGNPLLDFSTLPRFDEIRPEHVVPAIDTLLSEAQASIDAAQTVSPVSWRTFVAPLDRAGDRLGQAFGLIEHLQSVADNPEMRSAYNEVRPSISRYNSAVAQNPALYDQYKRITETQEYAEYDEARRKVVENALLGFRLGGAELSADGKSRVAAIQEELSALSNRFAENVLDATEAYELFIDREDRLAGIPRDVLASCKKAAEKAGKEGWRFSLQIPVLLAVFTYAEDRELRETLYRALGVVASETGEPAFDNSANIRRILTLRKELAGLLGFASYAEYALVTRMAESPQQVLRFLRDLAERALPRARQEHAELEAFAAAELGLATVEPWDIGYVAEKLKARTFSLSSQEVKAYFTVPSVMSGLFDLVKTLYSVRIEPASAAVWQGDVRFFEVTDAAGNALGHIYIDLYARPGKRGGAWMNAARQRHATDGSVQTPLVFLVCNFGEGVDGKPATLSHGDVTTLFHEMGHSLHVLLTQVGAIGVAGIRGVEWDAVELPSQFMENFAWEWNRLVGMTAHVDTGEPLPRHLYDRMIAAKNFRSASMTMRQIELALFDMLLHGEDFDPERDEVMSLLEQVRDEVAVSRPPAWHRYPHAFNHIFSGSYAAGYYSYKWAEVLSADAYAAFEEAPDAVAETGARFHAEILSRGGSRGMAGNFEAFRRRAPTIDALLRHNGLIDEPEPVA